MKTSMYTPYTLYLPMSFILYCLYNTQQNNRQQRRYFYHQSPTDIQQLFTYFYIIQYSIFEFNIYSSIFNVNVLNYSIGVWHETVLLYIYCTLYIYVECSIMAPLTATAIVSVSFWYPPFIRSHFLSDFVLKNSPKMHYSCPTTQLLHFHTMCK